MIAGAGFASRHSQGESTLVSEAFFGVELSSCECEWHKGASFVCSTLCEQVHADAEDANIANTARAAINMCLILFANDMIFEEEPMNNIDSRSIIRKQLSPSDCLGLN